MSKNERFLKACRREPVDATPIWLMRQAGRYMPEYRALREKHDLLAMIKSPELAAEVTLQPLNAFDLDAGIIFSDILPLLEGFGLSLNFVKGRGPVLGNTLLSRPSLSDFGSAPAAETMAPTLEAIRMVQRELDGRIPLIGFSGAPFTLACYAIEGGGSKSFETAKTFMYQQPRAWHHVMEKLAEAVGDYLNAQAAAGADALQLFDSWVGLLGPEDYQEFVLPHSRRAIERAREGNSVPVIHFGTGTSGILSLIKAAGSDVVGVDWRIDLAQAWDILGEDVAVQGNLDPAILLGPPERLCTRTTRILDRVRGRPGHIFNLGHGIIKETPVENVTALVETVHNHSRDFTTH